MSRRKRSPLGTTIELGNIARRGWTSDLSPKCRVPAKQSSAIRRYSTISGVAATVTAWHSLLDRAARTFVEVRWLLAIHSQSCTYAHTGL